MLEVNVLVLKNVPIWEQLYLEEALLRTFSSNWCLFNSGSLPAIVMGISGKPDQFLNYSVIEKYKIPVWRRFSGGGTVCVDQNTFFSTFIFNSEEINVHGSPDQIYQWSKKFYEPIFNHLDFDLKERDYVFKDKKFGGNAQYIRSQRWLHHSSFLWDFNEEYMNSLLLPPKMPNYRNHRNHQEFLYKLKSFFRGEEEFLENSLNELEKQFNVKYRNFNEVMSMPFKEHRKATTNLISF